MDKQGALDVGLSMNPARKNIEEARAHAAAISKARSQTGLTQALAAQRIYSTQGEVARLKGGRLPLPPSHSKITSAAGAILAISFEHIGSKQHKSQGRSMQSRENKGSCVGN